MDRISSSKHFVSTFADMKEFNWPETAETVRNDVVCLLSDQIKSEPKLKIIL